MVVQLFFAERVFTDDLATDPFVLVYLFQLENFQTEFALNVETGYDFLNHSGSPSDSNIFMAHWTVFIQTDPALKAEFAEELVAVVAFFGVSSHF
jgi:hypothetical protein